MPTIKLVIKGIGPPPSFKNNKRAILDRNTGKMRTLTDPKTKRWMEACTSQFESQLLTACPTIEGETAGEWRKRLLTVLSRLQDDSHQYMLPGQQSVERVEKGMEGVDVTIEF